MFQRGGAAGDVELVLELADDLLERVLGGDDADGGAELVDDDGDLAAAFLELLQQLDGEFGLGDDGDLAHHLAQREAGVARAAEAERDGAEVHQARDVLGVDDADDLLGAAGGVEDGNAGVLLLDDARAGLLDGHVGGEREDLAARSHDLADGDVVQLDGAMDDLFLEDGQQAHAAGRGGDELELLGRVDGALAAERCAKEAQDQRGGVVHQPHRRTRDADEDVHGAGDGERDALGSLQRERLGNQLAEQHLEVSDERERDDDRDGVRVDVRVARRLRQPAGREAQDDLGDRRLADPAERESGQRDAELHGGKELVDGVLELQHCARAGTAQRDQLLDARLPHADESELRGDEKTVGQNEKGHHHCAEEHPLQHL